MDQQASYALQAFAMAAAAGYQRSEFYQMVDQNPCTEPAVWGVTRDDGSRRPVSDALRTELQDHCKRITAPYKYPREIEFLNELPKTISGKIRRVQLRMN